MNLLDPEPMLRAGKPAQALDAASAGLGWFIPQMRFESFFDRGPYVGPQTAEVCAR